MTSDSNPPGNLSAEVTSDVGRSSGTGLFPPTCTTDPELAVDHSEMTPIVDDQPGQPSDGMLEELVEQEDNSGHGEAQIGPESLELSGETIISYSSSSVENPVEHPQDLDGADRDVFLEQGEGEQEVEPDEQYDADVDSEVDDLEEELNRSELHRGNETGTMNNEEEVLDPPPDQEVEQVITDTHPSTSTGITAESFSEFDEGVSAPPRRSKRIRQPRKIFTYTRKGEPNLESLPPKFYVGAEEDDTPEE